MNTTSAASAVRLQDGWFAVKRLRGHIFAISEPLYCQNNFSYLVVGSERALMIDAGASQTHDLSKVVEALTTRPYAVLPTHLHYDHLGGIAYFREIWLADTPVLAEFQEANGRYLVPLSYTLGGSEGFHLPPLTPSRLVKPGEVIDLGGVRLEVILAPGHMPDEIVLFDREDNILFTGDFLYPSGLYCDDLQAYAESADYLLGIVDAATLLLGAHPHKTAPEEVPAASFADLRDLKTFFTARANKAAVPLQEPLNRERFQAATRYRVNDRITFLEDIIWADGTPYKNR